MDLTILRFDTIDSTNSEALRQARQGASEGLCIVAGRQTAGRGRHGRIWASPEDAGLYFSILLKPKLEPRHLTLVTLMSAVAVAKTLEKFGVSGDIKWVNDVLAGGRKICGILAESAEIAGGLALVVGIGINLRSAAMPPEISETATSIEAQTGQAPSRDELLGELIPEFIRCYTKLGEDGGPEWVRSQWSERSSFASGREVSITAGDEAFTGVTRGIEENGALRVEVAPGTIRIVQAGDVRAVRGPNKR